MASVSLHLGSNRRVFGLKRKGEGREAGGGRSQELGGEGAFEFTTVIYINVSIGFSQCFQLQNFTNLFQIC